MSAEARGWTIRRWLSLFAVVEAVLLLAAVAGGVIALNNLTEARNSLLDVIGPQRLAATQLSTALLNQETGIRGYQLGRQPDFLTPYTEGRQAEGDAVTQLRQLGALPGTQAGDDLEAVLRAATAWQAVAAPAVEPGAGAMTPAQIERGRALFDTVRRALGTQFDHLTAVRDAGRADLDSAGTFLTAMLVAIGVLVVLLFAVLFLGLRRVITRPILRLAGEVRQTADQDIHHPVRGSGPSEIAQLGADVEAMRLRILDEVAELERAHALLDRRTQELDRRTHELERSNADLEQFAYVASHDLQEPLRKVASFCQLLQRRYEGLLDERGEQYIEYAVDGAKRMQVLINDLLAFSRVGRKPAEHVVVDAGRLADDALANLEVALSLSGGKVDRGELPRVRVEPALVTAVFQNLIGNALKFKGDAPPEVRVSADRDGDDWVFTVSDNGIGIDAEYAERVFALFQRLHTRSAYPGTGIGLALCRRIVEYHGGRIWLDTEAEGTTFRFTLPAATEDGGDA
ncbi:ATP-binding protein [Amycolatopsis sp. NPDC098790]|uniref:sensor histidine kinase n=1 Tax=Amycolatopsis sp. NPDC098790 TaxID=3363939 RepID=UPI0038279796